MRSDSDQTCVILQRNYNTKIWQQFIHNISIVINKATLHVIMQMNMQMRQRPFSNIDVSTILRSALQHHL